MRFSRRAFLASTACLAFAHAARAEGYVKPVDFTPGGGPPVAPVRPVVETLWGHQITDRYRWMEAQGPEWQAYMRAQGAYAAKVLAALPGRDALAEAIGKNTAAVAAVVSVQTGGETLFIERRPAGANTSKLFMRAGANGAETLLIDPDSYAKPGEHAELDWWEASPDGAHVVFGVSSGGSERSVLRVLDVTTNTVLPEQIDRTNWASPSWLPDGSGFFYNRLQDVSPDSLDYEKNSLCWLHRLNTDPAQDVKLFGHGLDASVPVQDIDAPGIAVTPGSDIAIGMLESGVQNELTLYAAKLTDVLAGHPGWVKICAPEDAVTGFAVRGAEIFLLTHKHAPHYKVLKLAAEKPQIANAVEVVPQSMAVIRAIAAARDGLYIRELDAGLAGLRHLGADGKITQVALPFSGAIDEDSFYADTLHGGAWFGLESWVRPQVICHVAPDGGVMQTDIAPRPEIDVSPYVSEEVFATARDGARVPLSIVYRKGVKRDGAEPLLMEAYGAYGITLDPVFLARWLPFLDAGGVFAVAHVRGGGELGEEWHLAGQKAEKYHTWQDAEDCVLHLIEAGYTSHRRVAVIGGSAGGITVGRLLTERPELVAAVIDMVGVSDALRSEFSPNGPPNIPEFGTVKTEEGFHDLLAMDAYQHVHDKVKYPSVLLTTGMNDPRVAPWEPAKMAARLQAATASGNPVLLRVDTDAGHGIGSTRAQRDQETADIMAFVLWRTGDPRYQPKV
ncbi:prolyl oligopeptidase family serine peptidase [Acidocella aromatica]|uniref:prolyl oligopeptidase n=1 Tax=Acidocella aromatica TaxID=1303579 RepID=A0A840VQ30_9PROT|nr:prolyl oligopeptidase family serine peptidase [Acidocella aromatica]MBB5373510.1 prolyl oligopeptidase [Acidocella aromatica]